VAAELSRSHVAIKRGSERNFGFVIAAALSLVLGWRYAHGVAPHLVWLLLIALLLTCALFAPKALAPFNKLWFALGQALGKIVAPLVMAAIFFLILTPIALWRQLRGHDALGLHIKADSTWRKRDSNCSFERQF
jgi:Saxitoxin biosynthesis operon protein SxtJ